MSNANRDGKDEPTPNDLALALDIDEWERAGQLFLRIIGRLGGDVPPLDVGRAAELSWLIQRADDEFERWTETWKTFIRPRLKRHEGKPIPPLTFL